MTSIIQKLWPFCQLVPLEFPLFPIEKEKETAVILKHIDEFPPNLAKVHNLVGSLIEVIKISIFLFFLLFPLFSIVHLLPVLCSNFDTPSEVQDVH